MKIVIFTAFQIYSNKIIKELISNYKNEIEAIYESGVILPNLTKIEALRIYFQKSGFYYTILQVIKIELFKVASFLFTHFIKIKIGNKLASYKSLAQKFGIKVQKVTNINESEFQKLLASQKPDLIVSVLFNQLLNQKTIEVPKLGVINIHPAYLPNYRGVSPTFWVLAKGEKTSGVSVHFIDKKIDSGAIIARQKITILKNDSEDSLYWRAAKIGSALLIKTIKDLKSGKVNKIENRDGTYFSIPTKEAVKQFKKKGRSFFSLYEYLIKDK